MLFWNVDGIYPWFLSSPKEDVIQNVDYFQLDY
jgi:hypothetical protein